MTELARRYARALYESAPEVALETSARQMQDQPELWQALCSPAILPEEKQRVLGRLPFLKEGTLLRFYNLLAKNGRMALLPEIIEAFTQCRLQAKGAAKCVLRCVQAPSQQTIEKLRRALCRLHKKDDIQFEIQIDPQLLGGFTLELEGVLYDKSVRGALEGMRRHLEERRMA